MAERGCNGRGGVAPAHRAQKVFSSRAGENACTSPNPHNAESSLHPTDPHRRSPFCAPTSAHRKSLPRRGAHRAAVAYANENRRKAWATGCSGEPGQKPAQTSATAWALPAARRPPPCSLPSRLVNSPPTMPTLESLSSTSTMRRNDPAPRMQSGLRNNKWVWVARLTPRLQPAANPRFFVSQCSQTLRVGEVAAQVGAVEVERHKFPQRGQAALQHFWKPVCFTRQSNLN